jgi:hypothetical protein
LRGNAAVPLVGAASFCCAGRQTYAALVGDDTYDGITRKRARDSLPGPFPILVPYLRTPTIQHFLTLRLTGTLGSQLGHAGDTRSARPDHMG